MTNTTQPAPEPDMIAQAGKLLNMLQQRKPIAYGTDSDDLDADDHTIVLASAILAVAAELRAIDNHLADLLDMSHIVFHPKESEVPSLVDIMTVLADVARREKDGAA